MKHKDFIKSSVYIPHLKDAAKELRDLVSENAALRAQLAQGEPVAKTVGYYGGYCTIETINPRLVLHPDILLYTAPQQAPVDEPLEFALGALDWLERNAIREMFYPCLQQRTTEALLIVRRGLEARAALKPAVPEGYQLVPIETTWDIVKAGIAAFDMSSAPSEAMRKAYKAMLAAAKDT